ncbi:MAG: hypothetical protein WBQ72_22995, partial [Terriglobales bacterium]
LAMMFEEGKGSPTAPDLAAHYYALAAEQGLPRAQLKLGSMLARNTDSRADRIAAYKWLMLAQDSLKESSPAFADLRKLMDAKEIEEASQQVDNWRLTHPKRP